MNQFICNKYSSDSSPALLDFYLPSQLKDKRNTDRLVSYQGKGSTIYLSTHQKLPAQIVLLEGRFPLIPLTGRLEEKRSSLAQRDGLARSTGLARENVKPTAPSVRFSARPGIGGTNERGKRASQIGNLIRSLSSSGLCFLALHSVTVLQTAAQSAACWGQAEGTNIFMSD